MIGFLKGEVIDTFSNALILDVNGVGYRVEMGTVDMLVGQKIALYIHTHVREQELRLFGFKEAQELDIFEKLLEVQGVGPKVALVLISSLGVGRILDAVERENPYGLKAPGVGSKTAQKILIELKGKIKTTGINGNRLPPNHVIEDAIAALEGLGYKRYEINEMIAQINIEEGWGSEDVIRMVLKKIKTEKD